MGWGPAGGVHSPSGSRESYKGPRVLLWVGQPYLPHPNVYPAHVDDCAYDVTTELK